MANPTDKIIIHLHFSMEERAQLKYRFNIDHFGLKDPHFRSTDDKFNIIKYIIADDGFYITRTIQ